MVLQAVLKYMLCLSAVVWLALQAVLTCMPCRWVLVMFAEGPGAEPVRKPVTGSVEVQPESEPAVVEPRLEVLSVLLLPGVVAVAAGKSRSDAEMSDRLRLRLH